MSVIDIIKRRRSIGKMTSERPTREQIEKMLEAATHAPNHYKVQPWKFFVLAGSARQELGVVMAESLSAQLEKKASNNAEVLINAEALINKERIKPLRSPVVIIVATERPHQPKVLEIENVEATAAAVQNMLLTAEEMELACMWCSGDAAFDPRVKEWLGLSPENHIVAFVYVGFPAIHQR